MTKSIEKVVTRPEINMAPTSQKCPEISHLMLKNGISREFLSANDAAFLKISPLEDFQDANNERISRVRRARPVYRRINKYTKSIRQYWKERSRRKKAHQLHSEGFTYKQIAAKLGVCRKTIQRDIKKTRCYYVGQINRAWRIMEEERHRRWAKELEGLNIFQQYKIISKRLAKFMKARRGREYKRHLLKLIIDMDDLKHGVFPTIKAWPSHKHFSITLPLHVQFILRANGKNMKYGGFTIG